MSGKSALLALVLSAIPAALTAQQSAPEIRLLFTGDVMLSRLVNAEIIARKDSPWKAFNELFHSADLVGGNFEGAIGSPAECLKQNHLCFAAAESSTELMKSAGFRMVTAENNHSGDLGQFGRDQTRAVFYKSGLLALDFDNSPQFYRINGVTVAMIAITTVKAADGTVEQIPSVELMQKLRLARQLANLVLVSIHWGNELQDWPTDAQELQAKWLVEHGADLIVGHHPHVVQTPKCIEGKPVFFSLGNHLFDQKYAETKDGLIADCRIRGGQLSCGALRTHTDAATSYPTLGGRDAASDQALQNCTSPLGPGLQVGDTAIKPMPWSANEPTDGLVMEGYRDGNLQWRSRRQKLVSIQSAKAMGTEPLLLSLERHLSSIDNEVGLRPYVYAIGPHGLIARWRGSALAWPLVDAVATESGVLCALHRGDSFLLSDPSTKDRRIAAYRWNGFGFKGIDTQPECEKALQ